MVDPNTGRERRSSTSPWVWVGCGCGLAVVLAMAAITGLGWWGYRSAKEFADEMSDPKARAEKTRTVLNYDQLPPGYYALGSFSIPFVMDIAFLGTEPPAEAPATSDTTSDATQDKPDPGDFDMEMGDTGFIYMNMKIAGDNKEDMRRTLRGEEPRGDSRWTMNTNVNYETEELIRRGTVKIPGGDLLYSAGRGHVNQDGRERKEGIVTLVMPDCPGDDRLRFGIWFSPDPSPEKTVEEVDWTGTPADPKHIEEFVRYFKLCPGKAGG